MMLWLQLQTHGYPFFRAGAYTYMIDKLANACLPLPPLGREESPPLCSRSRTQRGHKDPSHGLPRQCECILPCETPHLCHVLMLYSIVHCSCAQECNVVQHTISIVHCSCAQECNVVQHAISIVHCLCWLDLVVLPTLFAWQYMPTLVHDA